MTSQHRYLPFGQVRTDVPTPNSPNTDFGYTGQRNLDDDIGLMDYRARFYSPVLNRFIQPDMIVPGMYNPQMLNRFSYVGNNPVNFNDPSGHVICEADGSFCFDPQMHTTTGNLVGNGCNGCWTPPKQTKDIIDDEEEEEEEEDIPQPFTCSSSICNPNGAGAPPTILPNLTTDDWEMPNNSPCTTNLCDLEFILALADFLAASAFSVALLSAGILIGVAIGAGTVPIWAGLLGMASIAAVAFVALNVVFAGFQVLYSYSHPELNIDIDPLPLVPDEWHIRK